MNIGATCQTEYRDSPCSRTMQQKLGLSTGTTPYTICQSPIFLKSAFLDLFLKCKEGAKKFGFSNTSLFFSSGASWC